MLKKTPFESAKQPKLPLPAIMSLPEDVLLSLRQIARQGRLEPEEHAVHFQLNPTTSESHLAQLAHWGLIRRSEESSAYVLNTDLEGCIYRALTAKELAG